MEIFLNNPTITEIINAAKNAIIGEKEYIVHIWDKNNVELLYCNGFDDRGRFFTEEIQNEWSRCCDECGVWDEFERVYSLQNEEDEYDDWQ